MNSNELLALESIVKKYTAELYKNNSLDPDVIFKIDEKNKELGLPSPKRTEEILKLQEKVFLDVQ